MYGLDSPFCKGPDGKYFEIFRLSGKIRLLYRCLCNKGEANFQKLFIDKFQNMKLFLKVFETGSHIVQTSLEFTVYPKMTLSF